MAGSTNHRPSGEIAPPRLRFFPWRSTAIRSPVATSQSNVPEPSDVGVARSFPSGLKIAASRPDAVPWRRPRSCGCLSTAASTVLRVSASSRSRCASTARSMPTSGDRSMTERDTAATRATSARSRASVARWRDTSASPPAITAATNATAMPASKRPAPTRRSDLLLAAGVEEVAFERRQVGVGRKPVHRRGQSRSSVELAGHPPERVPRRRRRGDVPMDAQPLASFVDPRLEARPLSDQRLVRDLDRTLVDGDEARSRQRPHDGRDAVATELVQCRTTTRVHRLARFDEPEEDRAGQLLVRRVEFIQHAVCRRRDRAAHASGRVVAVEGEPATVPSFPRRMQRVREEWKGTGFTFHLGDEHVDEPDLDAQPGRPRRFGDRPTKLVGGHRTEQHLISRDSFGESRRGSRNRRRSPLGARSQRAVRARGGRR